MIPMACALPRSASLVTVAGLMSTLTSGTDAGRMFPVAIAVGYGIGYGLDHLFGTKPWCTIIFSIVGIAAAFVNLFKAGLAKDGGEPPSGT